MQSPTWVYGALVALSFAAGIGLGFGMAIFLSFRSLTSGTPLAGFGSPNRATVLHPAADAEQRAAQMAEGEAVEFGARQLMEMAASQGQQLSYEEAAAQARASIRDLFPEL